MRFFSREISQIVFRVSVAYDLKTINMEQNYESKAKQEMEFSEQ